MDFDTLWAVGDRARARPRLAPRDISFVRDEVPDQLDSFPKLKLPASIRHPAGFSISGASVGTLLRGTLLIAGQKASGKRFGGSEFYERVEKDLAFGIMRSRQWRFAQAADTRMVRWTLGDPAVGRRT